MVTSVFFVEVFFATKDLLGWPRTGQLPARFQLLWVRVVEPDSKTGNRGAIYLWIEEVDDNNVPDGVPRSYRLPYSRPLADRSAKARDEIMSGKPAAGPGRRHQRRGHQGGQEGGSVQVGQPQRPGLTTVDLEQFQLLQQAQRVEFAPMPCRRCRRRCRERGEWRIVR